MASQTPSTPVVPPTGGGTPEGGRGGRGTGRSRRNRNRNNNNRSGTPTCSFKGEIADMGGHVFRTPDEGGKPTDFKKTMEKFSTYCSVQMKSNFGDFEPFFESLDLLPIPYPTSVSDEDKELPTSIQEIILKKRAEVVIDRRNKVEQNSKTFCVFALQQCTPAVKTKLENFNSYKEKKDAGDCVWLMTHVRDICYDFDTSNSVFLSLRSATNTFATFEQGDLSLGDYLKEFKARLAVLEENGGSYGVDPGRMGYVSQLPWSPAPPFPDEAFSDTKQEVEKDSGTTLDPPLDTSSDVASLYALELEDVCRDHAIAIHFLMGSGRRYENLRRELRNKYNSGEYKYPRNLVAAHELLEQYTPLVTVTDNRARDTRPGVQTPSTPTSNSDQLAFAQTAPVPGTDGRTHAHITCHSCSTVGHYASVCPTPGSSTPQVSLLQVGQADSAHGFSFTQVVTTSSREAELSASRDHLADVLWTQDFLALNDLYHQAPLSLFDSDDSDDATLPTCSESDDDQDDLASSPTEPILADVYTKPLDPALVTKFRSVLAASLSSHGFSFAQPSFQIPPSWVLLDSESTVSIFSNRALLKNIRPSPTTMTVHGSGGNIVASQIGDIPNFGPVWFQPQSIANILSLASVTKKLRVTMDSAISRTMTVHRLDGSPMVFSEHPSGLYYHDVSSPTAASPPAVNPISTTESYSLLTTVDDNKKKFTRREVERADLARDLYRKIGRPSETQFQHILANNLIHNSPVTVEDAKRALAIYGPDLATLKGKSKTKPASPHPTIIPSCLPDFVLRHHKEVTLSVDLFYVQSLPFFHSISNKIKFRTSESITNRRKPTLLECTNQLIGIYENRGFTVTNVHADGEFACIRHDVRPAVHIAAPNDHVHEVERSIQTIKARTRCTVQGLPFKRLPRELIKGIVAKDTSDLNLFPAQHGISETISPVGIVRGDPPPDFNKLKFEFGDYVLVDSNHTPTNTQVSRKIEAIALHKTGNASGDYYFLNLHTGNRVTRTARSATRLPISTRVIDIVESLAEQEGQPLIGGAGLLFEWGPNHPILDEDHIFDMTHDVGDDDAEPFDIIDDFDDFDNDEADDNGDFGDDVPHDPAEIPPMDEHTLDDAGAPILEIPAFDPEDDASEASSTVEVPDTFGDDPVAIPAPEPTATATRYNLRPGRNRSYSHRLDHQMDSATPDAQTYATENEERTEDEERTNPSAHEDAENDEEDATTTAFQERNATSLFQATSKDWQENLAGLQTKTFGYVFTQMSAAAGIKKHGQVAIDALFTEFMQFQDMEVFSPMPHKDLTRAVKKAALRAVNLIKEKRSGKVKGRSCADGSKQRGLYEKAKTTSPTLTNDALMLSCMIDAAERRDTATADVAGAYLNAKMDDFVCVRFEGDAVDIMCTTNSSYLDFVVTEGGKKVLYLRLLKALYGCVQSSLLWYNLFTGTLEKEGFKLNPYEPCVANKIIHGKQCTVCWYVDDTKISHADPEVVTSIIELIEGYFGKMSVTRGKDHVFLGMNLKFNDEGQVQVSMFDSIREIFEDFGEDVTGGATSPMKSNGYSIDDKSPLLTAGKAAKYHSIAAKLIHVSNRARGDILPTVGFLSTRVKHPRLQDWMKLKRALQYLYATIDLYLTLGADNFHNIFSWADASYAMHSDMKSQTGGCMSLGYGAFMAKSSKQKINTKSSTEAELVGASDYLPSLLWARNFLEGQGIKVDDSILYQDNQSAIRLEVNGRSSAGQKSRHIDIRYFFITDRIKNNEVRVDYCPTEQMLADFYTKPLQGALFTKFRSVILGYEPFSTLIVPKTLPTGNEERVGEYSGHPAVVSDKSCKSTTTTQKVKKTRSVGFEDPIRTEKKPTYLDILQGSCGTSTKDNESESEMDVVETASLLSLSR